VDGAVKAQVAAGVPAGKIVLGVPFYGRGWTEVSNENYGLYQASVGKHFEAGYDKLAEDYINTNGFVRFWDDAAKAPYLWNAQSRTFISYADPEALTCKTDYIKSHGLAGVMFWEYHQQLKQKKLLDALWQTLRKP
jgi:chitinase